MSRRHQIADSFLGGLLRGVARRRFAGQQALLKILIYHDVPQTERGAFRTHVRYIHEHYGFITPDDLPAILEGRMRYTSTRVLLTFDDGFHSNAVVAEQILEPLGVKALFFIPPGFIDATTRDAQRAFIATNIFRGTLRSGEISDAMRPMAWTDAKALVDHGHTIGAHTIDHRRLTEIEFEGELRREVIGSGEVLQQRLGVPVDHFAYPFGDINSIGPRAMPIIRERFSYCHSGIRGVNVPGTAAHSLLRDPVCPGDPLAYVKFIVEDGLGLMYRRRALSVAGY